MLESKTKRKYGFLFCVLTIFLGGEVIFLAGFFPALYQRWTPAEDSDAAVEKPADVAGVRLEPPTQRYHQTVMMLIDALRLDFPTANNMPFAHASACHQLKLRVEIPTVTMPRLKSLTTGTVSNFIDIVLNIGQAEQLDDSLLHRLQKRNYTVVFAGDRTWTELFPHQFRRKAPNIDSFFVQDFYEGDKNVTKVLSRELELDDWQLLILHYLGLDHIGHVEGNESPKIPTKLKEMDDVVRQIYDSKKLENQLVLLTGDHGMRNGGGHGGSTVEELYVPLLIFKKDCIQSKYRKALEYNQIDLAPTLAILLAVDIPAPSIGNLIPELLHDLPFEDQLYAYHYNTLHLLRKSEATFGESEVKQSDYYQWYTHAVNSHKRFLLAKRNEDTVSPFWFEQAKLDYRRAADVMSYQFAAALVRFNYDLIALGLALTSLVTIYALLALITRADLSLQSHWSHRRALVSLIVATVLCVWYNYIQFATTSTSYVFRSLPVFPLTICTYIATSFWQLFESKQLRYRLTFMPSVSVSPALFICYILTMVAMSSSSFIEYELQLWYYLGSSILLLLLGQSLCINLGNNGSLALSANSSIWPLLRPIAVISTVPFLRYLDNATIFNNKSWLSAVVAIALLSLVFFIQKLVSKVSQLLASLTALLAIFCFRSSNGVLSGFSANNLSTTSLYIFWLSLALVIAFYCKASTRRNYSLLQVFFSCILLLSALLHKSQNIILLPAMLFTLQEAYKLCEQSALRLAACQPQRLLIDKVFLTVFVANMFYFYQGNSNSLATIDLNPGYIGQSSYKPLIVATFVTLNSYSAPINAFLYLILHVSNQSGADEERKMCDTTLAFFVYALLTLLPVMSYLWLLTLFRYHLFIYSVFAPKVLYACFTIVVLYLKLFITNAILYVNSCLCRSFQH